MNELIQLAGGEEAEPETVAAHYVVELLFDEAPELDVTRFARALEEIVGEQLHVSSEPDGELDEQLGKALGAPVAIQVEGAAGDAGEPPSWLLTEPLPLPPSSRQSGPLSDALSQSWWWPDAESAALSCRSVVRIADRRMLGLDYQKRLRRMQQVAATAIEAFAPQAVHWVASEQLVEPVMFSRSVRQDEFRSPLPGGFNVRFFRLEFDETKSAQRPQDQEFLMDTRGLTALGLIDLQCHFRGLDPEDVSHVLYSTGNYLFAQGRVIAAGNTVQGPGPRDAWLCRTGDSVGPPPREVIDLDPGFPFAAQDYDDGDSDSDAPPDA